MSDRDEEGEEKGESSDLEEETRRLMKEAMKSGMPDKVSTPPSIESPEEEGKAEIRSATAVQIDETFQRIQARLDDLLSGIEDSLKAAEPGIDKQVSSCVKNLETVLKKEAGLGVFATKTAKLVKGELETNLTIEQLLAPVFDTISESRATVEDILMKAGRGAVRDVGRSTGGLQTRLVQVYTKLTELESQLETTRADVREWRTRANELEDLIKSKEESIEQSGQDMVRLRETQDEMTRQMEQRDQEISSLKGELNQAQSQIEQQKQLLEKLDSAEEIMSDYEAKLVELSETQGKLAENEEKLAQKETVIESLNHDIEELKESKSTLESQIGKLKDELASFRGSKRNYQAEIDVLEADIAELKARWDMLYQVAEEEPAFKAYFIVAGKKNWFPIEHISSALGIPTVLLKRQIQRFIDAGMIELEGDKIRASVMLAEKAAELEEKAVKKAKAELKEPEEGAEEEFGDVPGTEYYTGPADGEDYEQPGR